jgi:hypothetical protein
MAAGAFLAIDIPAFILAASDGEGDLLWVALALMAAGGAIMYAGYRAFRHTEQYEYRRGGSSSIVSVQNVLEMVTSGMDVEKWINRLS